MGYMELLCQIGWSYCAKSDGLLCQIGWLTHPPWRKLLKTMHFHCAKSDGHFCRFSLPIVPNRMVWGKIQEKKSLFHFVKSLN